MSPDINKLTTNNNINQVVVQEENSPFPFQRADTARLSTQAIYNKQSFISDANKNTNPFTIAKGSFNDRL